MCIPQSRDNVHPPICSNRGHKTLEDFQGAGATRAAVQSSEVGLQMVSYALVAQWPKWLADLWFHEIHLGLLRFFLVFGHENYS